MKSKKYFSLPLTLTSINFLPLLSTNCKKPGEMNQALKEAIIEVKEKEQKLALEIKNVNDLNIKNLKQWKYSIVNFEITYSNPTTIKISFALQDRKLARQKLLRLMDLKYLLIFMKYFKTFQ